MSEDVQVFKRLPDIEYMGMTFRVDAFCDRRTLRYGDKHVAHFRAGDERAACANFVKYLCYPAFEDAA